MKHKILEISHNYPNFPIRREVENNNDKENKKYDVNIIGIDNKQIWSKINGIKSLSSNKFLNNFEDLRSTFKNMPIPITLQSSLGLKGKNLNQLHNSSTFSSELAPLAQVMKELNGKYIIRNSLKLCFYSHPDSWIQPEYGLSAKILGNLSPKSTTMWWFDKSTICQERFSQPCWKF